MDSTYGEFQGTDLDPSVDFDFDDDFEDEGNDLLPILGASVLLATVVGGVLVAVGRKRNPTPEERIQEIVQQLEKRGKKGAVQLEKRGRKGVQAVTSAVEDGKLTDLLDQALTYTRHRAADAGQAFEESNLSDSLQDALSRARKAAAKLDIQDTTADLTKSVRKSVRRGMKKAARDMRDFDLSGAVDGARKAAGNVDLGDVRKRAEDFVSSVRDGDTDPRETLSNLRARAVEAVGAVRDDLAPKAYESLKSDVIPAAQDAMGRVREDVIPAVQERVSQILEDAHVDERAKKGAGTARKGVESLTDVLKGLGLAVLTKVVDEVLPEAKKMGGRAVDTAREDVIPAVADTAGAAATRLREDVLPKVGEAAENAPDVLADLLGMARERVDGLLERAQPVAADAVEYGKHRASDMADGLRDGRHGIGGVISSAGGSLTGAVSSVGDGVTGALSSAGSGVKGAVGDAVDLTTHATRQLTAIMFWLSMLGGLILLIFVPDRDKQKEMWNGVRGFLGEVREMWRDLQGEDYQLEAPEDVS
ncbi:MAG: hypothetical protein ABI670_20285 [Chloroflexota bacterium]